MMRESFLLDADLQCVTRCQSPKVQRKMAKKILKKSSPQKASAKKSSSKGGKRSRLYTIVSNVITGFSLASVFLLLTSVASAYISPATSKYLSLMGLAFPLFLGGTVFMLFISLLFAWRRSWIPLVGLLLSSTSIYSYFPINFPSPPPKQSIKVITYNTASFGLWSSGSKDKNDKKGENRLVRDIINEHPDIVGYQEGYGGEQFKKHVRPILKRNNYYSESESLGGSYLGCFSKYPVVGKDVLCREGGNGAVLFKIKLSEADTLYFVVTHLKSMSLTAEDRTLFKENIDNLRDDTKEDSLNYEGLSHVARKIARASVPRALQADTIAHFIRENKHRNLIVCGDFNDTPVSYTYRTIINSGNLSDAFVQSGNGLGRTFNRYAMVVRIDHILYSRNHWEPHAGRILNRPDRSDHNAVSVHLKRKK
jgi:endonuclease/exonuclease/phosphatase family metal-dependent hydrolase